MNPEPGTKAAVENSSPGDFVAAVTTQKMGTSVYSAPSSSTTVGSTGRLPGRPVNNAVVIISPARRRCAAAARA
jgi:hypothetical protein